MVFAAFVDQQVVDHATFRVEHHSVEALSHGRAGHIVGENGVYESLGFGPVYVDLAHVAYVEHPAVVAHGIVFLHNPFVLDRHIPSGEGAHHGTEGHVAVVETRFLNLFHGCQI